ncbi:MAG TPA: succinate dehydrogenase, cytochrome b556 subunit [Devosiaceae bacterium]
MPPAFRPLSPHLQIYRLTLTMAMSIVHRITGAGLYLGAILLAWWLVAAAAGEGSLALFQAVAGSWFGQLVLFGFTWALFHHMLGGIRHFVWDFGRGFSHEGREGLAWFTLIGGLVLTALVWIFFVWL